MILNAAMRVTASDITKRTISGTIVPFGVTGSTSAGPTRIDAKAIDIPGKVVMLVGHDENRPIGVMAAHSVGTGGITAAFRIAPTGDGDTALLEAAEGLRDGLSVGLDVTASDTDEDGVTTVTAATLREVSLVTFPAFDDARVVDVAASETPDTTDSEPEPEPTQEETVEETTPAEAAPVVAAAPARVNAEAFPYRPTVQHSMFRDMVNASEDRAAAERFTRAQEMLTAAGQMRPDVATIIPEGYRPDMYQSQDAVDRPFVSSFMRYSVSDATPFRIPVFDSATGMIKDHTEGTNPDSGALAFTDLTITPKAVSGIYDISREALDAANPSLDAIIMRAIRESYNESTEAYVAQIITSGGTAGSALGTSLTMDVMGTYANFLTTRKLPADRVLVDADTFAALATEVDGNARPMNPYIGAVNADGTTAAAAAAVNVGGLAVRQAWSAPVKLTVARHTDAASWESGLTTWRWEQVAGPAWIRFAAFGYVAAGVLRADGVITRTGTTRTTTTK